MAGFFRRLFGKSTVAPPTSPLVDRDTFLKQLGEKDILIIAAIQGDGIDPSGMTKEQLLAELGRAASVLNEREEFEPYVYEHLGTRRLPFFTDHTCAETFVSEYSSERNRVFPFQLLGVKGSLLARALAACDVLVMNDRSTDEVELSPEEMAVIRQMWG